MLHNMEKSSIEIKLLSFAWGLGVREGVISHVPVTDDPQLDLVAFRVLFIVLSHFSCCEFSVILVPSVSGHGAANS